MAKAATRTRRLIPEPGQGSTEPDIELEIHALTATLALQRPHSGRQRRRSPIEEPGRIAGRILAAVLMLVFAAPIAEFMRANPDFEILGLFVLLLIGFVLFLEGGHVGHMLVNGGEVPYIPQWITIFILMLMFSVDLYQNWLERKREKAPVALRRRKK